VSTVYLVAQPSIARDGSVPDTSGLAKFGTVRVIFPSGDRPSRRPTKGLEHAQYVLREFDAVRDCIAYAGGDAYGLLLVGIVLERKLCPSVTLLRFDKPRHAAAGHYVAATLDFLEDA
jgi:hypothetical protein